MVNTYATFYDEPYGYVSRPMSQLQYAGFMTQAEFYHTAKTQNPDYIVVEEKGRNYVLFKPAYHVELKSKLEQTRREAYDLGLIEFYKGLNDPRYNLIIRHHGNCAAYCRLRALQRTFKGK